MVTRSSKIASKTIPNPATSPVPSSRLRIPRSTRTPRPGAETSDAITTIATAPLEIATILEGPLLDLSDPLNRWYRWSTWLAALKQAPAGKLNTLEFDSYSTLVSAALAGHGIALCWSGLLDQYLETGSLLRISEHAAKSHRGYYVTTPMSTARNAKLARVTSWLIKESVTRDASSGAKQQF